MFKYGTLKPSVATPGQAIWDFGAVPGNGSRGGRATGLLGRSGDFVSSYLKLPNPTFL